MVTLYKYRGQVDLIVTDPPYNTGQQFRYNDKWDTDPNDPDLGTLVAKEDGSRHTKWIKAMMPRLQMMKSMLKPSGIIAICIDDNELFHLGMLMDEVFGEDNRIGIINWQKTYSPKKTNHLSTATEYVLVYARDESLGKTGLLPRDEAMDARYDNTDDDPEGGWRGGDATAPQHRTTTSFAVQSPYTGLIHYPEGEHVTLPVPAKSSHHWRLGRAEIKSSLQATGVKYEERDLGDRRGPALVIKGSRAALKDYDPKTDPAVTKAQQAAVKARQSKTWPLFFFNDSKSGIIGGGRPSVKRYIDKVVKGRIPWTYWAEEDYETPVITGAQSWDHADSGHSQAGLNELDAIVGKGHGFQTVKPLRLIKKIIQLWCPPNGLVFDPYAGSGTTRHAVLELNHDTGADRRFIVVEQGSPDRGDKYARSLTWLRLRNAITGERPNGKNVFSVQAEPLGGGFEFRMLTRQIDAKTVLSMKKDELIDVVITSHWEPSRRGSPNLIRVDDTRYLYLVGMNDQNEGYFIIWDNGGPVGQLDRDTYRGVLKDAEKAGISPPYNVYARYEVYQSRNVRFWKIPDKILSHLGLNESSDRYNEDDEANCYVTPMESAVDDLLIQMSAAEASAIALGLSIRPKAIYVSTTNTVDGISIREDASRPFRERQARPILIWRHLVEKHGIDPATVAVYCDLKFDPKFPHPPSFHLLSGGDADFDCFLSGNFRHIIFNLGLQEGWDDPECAFAYIDKEMGSPEQVTQVVGRVLRQPNAEHYAAPNLNTAHFYIRTDEKGVFEAILNDIRLKLANDIPEITLTIRRETSSGSKPYLPALKQRFVPTVSIDSTHARSPIDAIIAATHDYREGGVNTAGKGNRIQVLQDIGSGAEGEEEWIEMDHSNRVTARWVVRREVLKLFPAHGDRQRSPINLCDIEQPKFDAHVEYTSAAAAHLREQAARVVEAYIDNSVIVQNALDHPYAPDRIPIDEAKLTKFKNALHEGYSDLNGMEKTFAEALDKTKRVWCRNPSQGGFTIPLLDRGNTQTFSPDFLVWSDKNVVAIDTKGDHLITEDAGRKLFYIDKIEDGPELLIRLVTEGEWTVASTGEFSRKSGTAGYSVWSLRQGKPKPQHCSNLAEAVELCLR